MIATSIGVREYQRARRPAVDGYHGAGLRLPTRPSRYGAATIVFTASVRGPNGARMLYEIAR